MRWISSIQGTENAHLVGPELKCLASGRQMLNIGGGIRLLNRQSRRQWYARRTLHTLR